MPPRDGSRTEATELMPPLEILIEEPERPAFVAWDVQTDNSNVDDHSGISEGGDDELEEEEEEEDFLLVTSIE